MTVSGAEIASWLLQTAIATGVATSAFFVLLPTKFGEKYLSFHFDRKLADLKDAQNQKIEALKEQLNHLGDRAKRSNEREYEALSDIWGQFVDAFDSTERCVTQFIEHPDFDRLGTAETAPSTSPFTIPSGQAGLRSRHRSRGISVIYLLKIESVPAQFMFCKRRFGFDADLVNIGDAGHDQAEDIAIRLGCYRHGLWTVERHQKCEVGDMAPGPHRRSARQHEVGRQLHWDRLRHPIAKAWQIDACEQGFAAAQNDGR